MLYNDWLQTQTLGVRYYFFYIFFFGGGGGGRGSSVLLSLLAFYSGIPYQIFSSLARTQIIFAFLKMEIHCFDFNNACV